jgi:hypothetical protein
MLFNHYTENVNPEGIPNIKRQGVSVYWARLKIQKKLSNAYVGSKSRKSKEIFQTVTGK